MTELSLMHAEMQKDNAVSLPKIKIIELPYLYSAHIACVFLWLKLMPFTKIVFVAL